MNWKKNIFSYAMWAVYTLSVGVLLVAVIGALGLVSGGRIYVQVLLAAGVAAAVGAIVVLFRLFADGRLNERESGAGLQVVLEAALAVLLLILGLVLRVKGLPASGEQAAYFETAKVAEGQGIPQMPHRASYLYLLALRGVFLFLGNKFSVGIWLQIVLQLLTALLLFLAVKKFAGAFAALTVLFLVTCSGQGVREALTLSPGVLYLLLFAVGMDFLCLCKRKELSPFPFLPCGVYMGVIGWLDAGGWLLSVFAAAVICSRWSVRPDRRKRMISFALYFGGALAGFVGSLLVDGTLSGKSMYDAAMDWVRLYQPEFFRTPIHIGNGVSPWAVLLTLLMTLGVFSFWCDRRYERMSVWIAAAGIAAAAESFQLLTKAVPGSMYLYLFLAVLAGVGVQQCFTKVPEGVTEESEVQNEEETVVSDETDQREVPASSGEKSKQTRYIENPLPLPKPHVKRVLDYDRKTSSGKDDYDFVVDENDDFDIK